MTDITQLLGKDAENFSNNDLNMMTKLSELVEHGFDHWKLDGVYLSLIHIWFQVC